MPTSVSWPHASVVLHTPLLHVVSASDSEAWRDPADRQVSIIESIWPVKEEALTTLASLGRMLARCFQSSSP